eukprot:UN00588
MTKAALYTKSLYDSLRSSNNNNQQQLIGKRITPPNVIYLESLQQQKLDHHELSLFDTLWNQYLMFQYYQNKKAFIYNQLTIKQMSRTNVQTIDDYHQRTELGDDDQTYMHSLDLTNNSDIATAMNELWKNDGVIDHSIFRSKWGKK